MGFQEVCHNFLHVFSPTRSTSRTEVASLGEIITREDGWINNGPLGDVYFEKCEVWIGLSDIGCEVEDESVNVWEVDGVRSVCAGGYKTQVGENGGRYRRDV